MLASSIPVKIPLAFAASGQKNTIPTASQITVTPGAASLTDGFPPLTLIPKTAGGIPPFGQDMNGILNLVSAGGVWFWAGGPVPYDAAFSTAIGGYPQGAMLSSATLGGYWISLVDNNTTNPDAAGAGWLAFTRGFSQSMTLGSTTTWTPPAGIMLAKFRLWAAGGAGGVGSGGGGGGGAGGGYAEAIVAVSGAPLTITIGAGGTLSSPNGGSTSVAQSGTPLISATGGQGGGAGPTGAGSTSYGSGAGPGFNSLGESGQNGATSSALLVGGDGGNGFSFAGGSGQIVGAGGNATGNNGQTASGGSGGVGTGNGGNGGSGLVIVEY